MTNNTRIYNRFTGYSTEDCRCEWCLHHGGTERPCLLEECCCIIPYLAVGVKDVETANITADRLCALYRKE